MQVPEGYILISKSDYEQLLNRLAMLEALVKKQGARIKELEAMLNKDSHNSHKPPGSDGYKKKIKNNREPSGKKVGGQLGHEGKTLQMVETPDKVVEHKVACCEHCGINLSNVQAKKQYRKQVHDLPPIKIEVTEHREEVKQCHVCGKETIADSGIAASVQYGERVKSMGVYLNQYQMLPVERTRETMEDLFECSISAEVLQQSNELCYDNLEQKVEREIKAAIAESAVMHNDETGIRCEGKTQWVHVSSTKQHTYYAIDEKRGKEAMERINILPRFPGTSVHDRWASYEHYENCDHAYCNAHLLRDLKFAEEELQKPWAAQMKTVLLDAYKLSQQKQIHPTETAAIDKKYDLIVQQGIKQEPLPTALPHTRGRKAKSKSLNLLECFRDKKKEVMKFLHDKNIPFDNNLAERDLRMIKLKQKISGCFRTRKGAEMFCRIRSYISTVKKQGVHVWESLQLGIKTAPLQPVMIRGG